MSAPKPTGSPIKSSSGAESPTTVRPLDMDDDDVQETAVLGGNAPNLTSALEIGTGEDAPPPKPPRPLSPHQQAENTLKEAFPSIDAAVVKAVLIASGGNIEPAFNALLGMTDPDAVVEPVPPRQPPRPTPTRTPQSQVEADEMYARQVAEHYDRTASYRQPKYTRGAGVPSQTGRQRGTGLKPNEMHDEGHSFLDDDLPIIRENLRKGFVETQKTVNSWINTLKKKIDGEDDGEDHQQGYQGTGGPQSGGRGNAPFGSRRSGEGNRRSGDYNRYDADPQVLGDDFAGIQLSDDGTPARRSTRPLANPDLFKPTPTVPKSSNGRKVSFQDDPAEDIDIYRSSPKIAARDTVPTGKPSKWQPLATVDPSPVGDAENDPFSLADSEDEKESKDRVGGKEIRMDDAERLKLSAADVLPVSPAVKPEPAEVSGTKDKLAEAKLTGKS